MLSMAQVGCVALAVMLASAARADEALDRCWAVKMGMSSEEVSRLLGARVPLGHLTGAIGRAFPCAFSIHSFGVSEIQINDQRAAPSHEAMFAKELRRGVSLWGQPYWIHFSDNRLKWFATWRLRDRGKIDLSIEPEPIREPLVNKTSGSLIFYMLTR